MFTCIYMKTLIAEVQKLVEKSEEGFAIAKQAVHAVEEAINILVEGGVAVDTAHITDSKKSVCSLTEMIVHVRSWIETATATMKEKMSNEIHSLILDSVEVIHAYMVVHNKTTLEILKQLAGDAEFIPKQAYVRFINQLADDVQTTLRSSFNLLDGQAEMMYTYMADKSSLEIRETTITS